MIEKLVILLLAIGILYPASSAIAETPEPIEPESVRIQLSVPKDRVTGQPRYLFDQSVESALVTIAGPRGQYSEQIPVDFTQDGMSVYITLHGEQTDFDSLYITGLDYDEKEDTRNPFERTRPHIVTLFILGAGISLTILCPKYGLLWYVLRRLE